MGKINDNNSSINAGNNVEVVGENCYKIAGNQVNITAVAPNPGSGIEELQRALDKNREDASENLVEIAELIRRGNTISTNSRLQSRVKDAITSMSNIDPLIQAIKSRGGQARSISGESNIIGRLNGAIKFGANDILIEDQKRQIEAAKEHSSRLRVAIVILSVLLVVFAGIAFFGRTGASGLKANPVVKRCGEGTGGGAAGQSQGACAPSPPPPAPDARIGKIGYLTTDLWMRDRPNKTASAIGKHYKDAEVRILDVTSFNTDDGLSTWVKVEVINHGTSVDSGVHGNRGGDEGWMNARYIKIVSQ